MDVNSATEAELQISLAAEIAHRVVKERENGHFASWDDLKRRVRGIGPAKID